MQFERKTCSVKVQTVVDSDIKCQYCDSGHVKTLNAYCKNPLSDEPGRN